MRHLTASPQKFLNQQFRLIQKIFVNVYFNFIFYDTALPRTENDFASPKLNRNVGGENWKLTKTKINKLK